MFKNLSPSALGISSQQSEIIELALTYGFRGIDINIQEFASRAEKHGMSYARRLIDSAHVRVGRFQLPISVDSADETFQDDLKRLTAEAETAHEIGCTRCICTIDPAGNDRPYHENFEFHRLRLAEICKQLEPFEIRLGVGFRAAQNLRKDKAFQFIHDLDALSLLVSMTGAANVGMLLDVWDLHVSGASVEKLQNLSADQIVAVHLADLPEETPLDELTDADRLLPGTTGRIDNAAILALLKEKGFAGPVTVKASRKAFDGTRRDDIVKQAGAALDQVWRDAGLATNTRSAARTP